MAPEGGQVMSAINNKSEADRLLKDSVQRSFRADGSSPVASVKTAQAQVHATLYLAEQQRIDNLIAYVNSRVSNGYGVSSDVLEEIDRALGMSA